MRNIFSNRDHKIIQVDAPENGENIITIKPGSLTDLGDVGVDVFGGGSGAIKAWNPEELNELVENNELVIEKMGAREDDAVDALVKAVAEKMQTDAPGHTDADA
jgi:hypothetical protein